MGYFILFWVIVAIAAYLGRTAFVAKGRSATNGMILGALTILVGATFGLFGMIPVFTFMVVLFVLVMLLLPTAKPAEAVESEASA